MQLHGSCVARAGVGVLLIGPSGVGKSDLALRMIGLGFTLVADDQVDIIAGVASAPVALQGLLEVRGLGILRLSFASAARLAVAISLGDEQRLPEPARHDVLDLPLVTLDPRGASAAQRASLALDCALGQINQVAGAFLL